MNRFLFLDDWHIARMDGLTRQAHQAVRHPANPVVIREHPWEQTRLQIYGRSVIYDMSVGKFRMYYLAQPGATHYPHVRINDVGKSGISTLPAYAESVDGIHWVKPALGQCSFNGVEPTNLLDFSRGMSFEPGVLFDAHDPDPQRRYKLFYWDQKNLVMPAGTLDYKDWGFNAVVQVKDESGHVIHAEPYTDWGIEVAFSADGIHWTRHGADYVFRCYSDTGHSCLYDPALGQYVSFGRFGMMRPGSGVPFTVGRNVARVTSNDFIQWSEPELVLCVDDRDPDGLQINSMPVDLYEGVYIGLMELFVLPSQVHAGNLQLATSRNGVHWTRVADRFNFLEPGTGNDWDSGGGIRPGSSLIVHDDCVMMYYSSGPRTSGFAGIGLATWRRDGFVSVHAGPQGGELLTAPLMPTGSELHLNLDATHGEATVQICNFQGGPGTPEEQRWGWSEPLHGDSTDMTVRWKAGDLAPFVGWPRTLRIKLRNADLYSFWWD